MNPILFVTIDKISIELHLRGTIKLHNREHGIYSPFYEKNILVTEDIIRIQFRNQLFNINNVFYPIWFSSFSGITFRAS